MVFPLITSLLISTQYANAAFAFLCPTCYANLLACISITTYHLQFSPDNAAKSATHAVIYIKYIFLSDGCNMNVQTTNVSLMVEID